MRIRRVSYRSSWFSSVRGKKLSRRQKRGLALIGASVLFLFFAFSVSRNVVPVMTEMAINQTNELITTAVNDAIYARLLDGSLAYQELIQLERDLGGTITALTTDMSRINTLQALITNEVIEQISHLSITEMRIPLGNIIGGSLLSGRGPGLGFRVVTLGNPTATFSNEFSTAGINQTKHQIMLDIAVQVNILVPGHAATETISVQMLVAETVIVGDVPGVFGQFGFQ
ncbi:MAG: sporulation protein YunB [Oscillospiraceae bacterium]|nr:sporulation protein YunB [Oscillospiraceae bacterium]